MLDVDHAKEKYEELVNLVLYGDKFLNLIEEKNYYEGNIDPNNGHDWNQSRPIKIEPNTEDFVETVNKYISWEVNRILSREDVDSKKV